MWLKDKVMSVLFGAKEQEMPDELPAKEQTNTVEEVPEVSEPASNDPSLLEVPAEHPLRQLYDLRRKEKGGLPPPRLEEAEASTARKRRRRRTSRWRWTRALGFFYPPIRFTRG